MGDEGRAIAATLVPIVAFAFVYFETHNKSHVHTARVSFGVLAIIGVMSLIGFARILSEDSSAVVMLPRFLPGALAIAAWVVVMRERISREGVMFATVAAAAGIALTVLGAIFAFVLAPMIAEAGRQGGPGVLLVTSAVASALSYTAIGIKAMRSVSRLTPGKIES